MGDNVGGLPAARALVNVKLLSDVIKPVLIQGHPTLPRVFYYNKFTKTSPLRARAQRLPQQR